MAKNRISKSAKQNENLNFVQERAEENKTFFKRVFTEEKIFQKF